MRLAAIVLCALVGCATPPAAPPTAVSSNSGGVLVGSVTRARVMAMPKWQDAYDAAAPDAAAANALATARAGATVDVYFGTWCPDSRREVTRLWKALDAHGGEPPFALQLVAVDRQKRAPELDPALGVTRVPTFVVRREGREVGRIVEHAPRGIETELAELLR